MSNEIWLLDRDKKLLKTLQQRMQESRTNRELIIRIFSNPRDAVEEIDRGNPSLVISDQVGLDPLASGTTFHEQLNRKRKLAGFGLYSGSINDSPEYRDYLIREKQIVFHVNKGDIEQLVVKTDQYMGGWESPVAFGIREHIKACDDPGRPYFPDGEGRDLSLYGIHREIVLGTDLGHELEEAWQYVLLNNESSPAELN